MAARIQGGEDGAGPTSGERWAGMGWGHRRDKLGVSPFSLCPRTPSAVKEEPCEEDPKPAQPKGPPGFPRDVSAAELLQRLSLAAEEELVFLQLPDTLPGQPPTHDSKPIKSELHNEDGQVVVVKQEKSQVGAWWGCPLTPGWDPSPPVVSSPTSPSGCAPIP